MKCLTIVIIAILSFAAADKEWKPPSNEDIDEFDEECRNEVSPHDLVINTSTELQYQYVLCRVKKMGVFSEKNGFDFDRLVAYFTAQNYNEEGSRRGIARCIETNERPITMADWASRTNLCLRKVQLMNQPRVT